MVPVSKHPATGGIDYVGFNAPFFGFNLVLRNPVPSATYEVQVTVQVTETSTSTIRQKGQLAFPLLPGTGIASNQGVNMSISSVKAENYASTAAARMLVFTFANVDQPFVFEAEAKYVTSTTMEITLSAIAYRVA